MCLVCFERRFCNMNCKARQPIFLMTHISEVHKYSWGGCPPIGSGDVFRLGVQGIGAIARHCHIPGQPTNPSVTTQLSESHEIHWDPMKLKCNQVNPTTPSLVYVAFSTSVSALMRLASCSCCLDFERNVWLVKTIFRDTMPHTQPHKAWSVAFAPSPVKRIRTPMVQRLSFVICDLFSLSYSQAICRCMAALLV